MGAKTQAKHLQMGEQQQSELLPKHALTQLASHQTGIDAKKDRNASSKRANNWK
jgi:hypothetical protein